MNPIDANQELLRRFSPTAVEQIYETVRPVFPELVEKLVSDVYGFAYSRATIDLKTRHLITLAVISSIGDCYDQLRFQLRAALNLGISTEEIKEVFIQVQAFAGNARAYNAARIFKLLQDELSVEE